MQEADLVNNFLFIVAAQFQQSGLNAAELFNQRVVHGGKGLLNFLKAVLQLQFILRCQPLFAFAVQTGANITE
ncbi:hypothetical protein D3C73_917160 [compost metagenome]